MDPKSQIFTNVRMSGSATLLALFILGFPRSANFLRVWVSGVFRVCNQCSLLVSVDCTLIH